MKDHQSTQSGRDARDESQLSSHSPSHPIDGLVETVLGRRASSMDTSKLADRILANSGLRSNFDSSEPYARPTKVHEIAKQTSTTTRSWRSLGWVLATAALLFLAFTFGRWESSAFASATSLVKAARSVHALALERCYVVTTKKSDRSNGYPMPSIPDGEGSEPAIQIWTQGNRFWVDIQHAKRVWAWGRNQEGDVWLTLGRNRGLTIKAEELGNPLKQLCELHSLELDSLLETFQNKFILTKRSATELGYLVTARPKRGAFMRIVEATLEIDRETKALRQLVLNREMNDGSLLQVSFTLVETRVPNERLYEPEGHLVEPSTLLTSSNFPKQRTTLLKTWFGQGAESWITE